MKQTYLAKHRADYLIETDWLAAHLDDPEIRIVDLQGAVKRRVLEEGVEEADYLGLPEDYAAGHIPGAIYLDWTRDIVDLGDPVPVQVAGAAQIAGILSARGIGDEHTVIAYDNHPASQFATRLWWVLHLYGHEKVKVLNGGLAKWKREGHPVTVEVPSYPRVRFTPRMQTEWLSTASDVLESLNKQGVKVLDARDSGQYTAQIRRGKRGGHIPGALSLPREELIDAEGRFKTNEELAAIISEHGLKAEDETRVIAYCNGGVAATTALFVLSLLGFTHLSNYDGSWNEWSEREDLPVER